MSDFTLCVDPGNEESGYCIWDGVFIKETGKIANSELRDRIRANEINDEFQRLTIEMIASYGMPCGKTIFETCVWIGKFLEAWPFGEASTRLVYRNEIKIHICKSPRANDGTIRQALIDRIGPIGKKASPGPTFGITGDMWSALAVAVYDHDTR